MPRPSLAAVLALSLEFLNMVPVHSSFNLWLSVAPATRVLTRACASRVRAGMARSVAYARYRL